MTTTPGDILLTNDVITNEALLILRNDTVFLPRVAKNIDSLFGQVGYKNGSTVRVRIPVRYTMSQGQGINLNNTIETQTSVTLLQYNIGVEFTTEDLKLSIDEFSSRILEPQIVQIASGIEQAIGQTFLTGAQSLSTPGAYVNGAPAVITGAEVATLRPFNDIRARLREQSTPTKDVYVAISPDTSAGVVDSLKGLFQDATEIAKQYRMGVMGTTAGFDWLESNCLPTFVSGTRLVAGGVVNGGGNAVVGSTITISNTDTGTITAGDMFVINGVNAINPLTRASTGKLQVFTVQTATAFTANSATVSVLPAINVTSPDQTVSAAAADGATVTWLANPGVSELMNVAWHRDAVTFAVADLPTDLPGAVASMARDPESGLAIRMLKQYQADTDLIYYRADVLFGVTLVRPVLAGKILA